MAMGDDLIESSKETQALGTFNSAEGSKAVNLSGFAKRLVYSTHRVARPFSPSSRLEPRLRYGATPAHNRHLGASSAQW